MVSSGRVGDESGECGAGNLLVVLIAEKE